MYHRTNMGVGSSTEDVIYSDTAATTAGSTDSSFVAYTVNNMEFSFKASLSPGIYSNKKRMIRPSSRSKAIEDATKYI